MENGAKKYIFPYTDMADIIFNSSLLYEFAVYKKHILSMQDELGNEPLVNSMLKLLDGFLDMQEEMIPRSSLIREFIGGSTLDI